MDYRFWTSRIGVLPDGLLSCLRQAADGLPYGKNKSFNPVDSFDSYKARTNVAFETQVQLVVDWLIGKDLFTKEDLLYYEVNRLGGGGLIKEHTDMYGPLSGRSGVCLTHKIHIPLECTGSGHRHRRTKYMPKEQSVLEAGSVYMYNNYVWHEAYNDGVDARREITLCMWDKQWANKLKFYNMIGLTGDGY